MNLYTFMHDKYAGTLSTSINDLIFHYDPTYIEETNAESLSHSIPVSDWEYTSFDCLHFFNALLPEGPLLENISLQTFISEYSTMKLLNMLGGDCSGAISFISSYENDYKTSEKVLKQARKLTVQNYQELNEEELKTLILNNTKKPFFISNKSFKMTLCGDQEKLALSYFNDKWHLPMTYAPTTHILKPSFKEGEEDLSVNEFICIKLAENLGLKVPETSLFFEDNIPVLVSKRFDRCIDEKHNCIKKYHQESFSQALGIKSYTKYQKDGGPSYKNMISLINEICTNTINQDIDSVVSIMIFNYLIGNCNAHGKNYAILYDKPNHPRLAPFFDLVSTTICSATANPNMSMSIGGEYNINKITKDHFLNELKDSNINFNIYTKKIAYFRDNYEKAFTTISNISEVQNYKYLVKAIKDQFKKRLNSLLK